MVLFFHYLFTCVSRLSPKLVQQQLYAQPDLKQHMFNKPHRISYVCNRYYNVNALQTESLCLKFLKQCDVLRQTGLFLRSPTPNADDWPYERQSLLWNARN